MLEARKEGGAGKLLISGHKVSILKDEQVLEICYIILCLWLIL